MCGAHGAVLDAWRCQILHSQKAEISQLSRNDDIFSSAYIHAGCGVYARAPRAVLVHARPLEKLERTPRSQTND